MYKIKLILLLLCSACLRVTAQYANPPAQLISSPEVQQLQPLWVKYTIDPGLKDSLDAHSSKINSHYQVMTLKESKAARKKTKSDFTSYISYQKNGVTNIILTPRALVNMGFRIMIAGDSCAVFYFSFEGEQGAGIFKLHKSDSAYTSQILVPAKLSRVTLLNPPEFAPNEVVLGHLEFECRPFRIRWDTYYDEEERSYAEGYFITGEAP